MPNKRIKVGNQYGWLSVVEPAERGEDGWPHWRCRCKCGTEVVVRAHNLRAGKKKSCGCMQREKPNNLRHGFTIVSERSRSNPKWRAHLAWRNLRTRCSNENDKDFPNYGGRGIDYDPRWEIFENFLADMGLPPAGSSLDRRDNSRGYWPDNCSWATKLQQQINRRNTQFLEFNGERLPISHWAQRLGIRPGALWGRLSRGWPLEKALITPAMFKDGADAPGMVIRDGVVTFACSGRKVEANSVDIALDGPDVALQSWGWDSPTRCQISPDEKTELMRFLVCRLQSRLRDMEL